MSTVYSHPQGAKIDLDGTTLTIIAENGRMASVQIGPRGLSELAAKFEKYVADFESAMRFDASVKKHVRREPERPFIGNLGSCLAETANHKPLGFSKITAVEYDELSLHLEAETACIFDASVTIYIRAGVSPDHAKTVLEEAARCLKTYESLEPWTPMEYLKSEPFADGEELPF